MTIYREDVERLKEIKDQMKELVEEARNILRVSDDKMIWERAKSYWIPELYMALDKDQDYLGGCMVTMEDTIEALDDDENVVGEFDDEDYEEDEEEENK